jgi:arylsulfatase A-like enzyme
MMKVLLHWFAVGLGVFVTSQLSAESRPNILFILADDLGWGDVGFHGAKILTPVLDRLAREGVELTQHYVNPQCSPTRSALLSGRYASRLDNLVAFDARAFPAGTMTLPLALQAAGYATALIGKWHLGSEPGARPWEQQGFDFTYGGLTGAVHPYEHTYRAGTLKLTWHRNGERVDQSGTHTTDLLAEEAIAWLGRQERSRPWFLYLPFFAPHTPVDAPPAWKERYTHEKFFADDAKNESAIRYAAMISHLDDAIGRVLATVQARGERENTLVIFVSDNGPVGQPWPDGALYGRPALPSAWLGSAGPLRGLKATTWEGGVRVPAIASWPGKLTPRTVNVPTCVVDWFPTFARLTGWSPASDLRWDGQDIWRVLSDVARPGADRIIYCKYGGGMAFLRRGDWKLVTLGDTPFSRAQMPGNDRSDQLFNIAEDPTETRDLARAEPQRLAELQRLLVAEMRKDDVGRVHRSAQFQWSRDSQQARLIPSAPAPKAAKP